MDKLHLVPVIHLENGQAIIEDKSSGEKLFTDPVDLAVELDELGFDELLIVDDEGEKKGEFSAYDLLYEIAGFTNYEIIAKGGLRTINSVEKIFEAGAARAMLTTLSILNPEMMNQLVDVYGSNSFVIGMDLMGDSLVYNHKKDKSEMEIEQIINLYSSLGIDRYSLSILNDLGVKTNPDPAFFDRVISAYPRIRLYAGEGIDNTEQFLEFENAGIKGLFLGDEFYTNSDLFKEMKKYMTE